MGGELEDEIDAAMHLSVCAIVLRWRVVVPSLSLPLRGSNLHYYLATVTSNNNVLCTTVQSTCDSRHGVSLVHGAFAFASILYALPTTTRFLHHRHLKHVPTRIIIRDAFDGRYCCFYTRDDHNNIHLILPSHRQARLDIVIPVVLIPAAPTIVLEPIALMMIS